MTSLIHPEEDELPRPVPDMITAWRAFQGGQSAVDQTQARAGCSGESAVDGSSCGCRDGGGELAGRDTPWDDVVRLWLNCGSSSPEMRPASLGRATETI